ncbi:lambda-crystallin homolog [Dreissena polymorpha]|uniref:Lambda-crystallin n=1 Tax=Dreissena polymorpha TaxID=45954 RepID=A0A9D4HZ29_DREPO|nr:lambda-crystallin homolog [Dreissena polymorpha]KAH3737977.1 hypothetical protein DPMN_044578 [Dreissena polymorpha]
MEINAPIQRKVAIIGSGLIGQNWAMLFASAGYQTSMYDVEPGQLQRALEGTRNQLTKYEQKGFLKGTGTAEEQAERISGTGSLQECLNGAFYVQECVPENLELKQKVFRELDALVGNDVILASSSSCLCASMIADGLAHMQNVLVAHPINPPYFVPLVEIVPAPFTSPDVVVKVRDLMKAIGQAPITLQRECLGFALNRIQYACINECWNMYKTGLLSAADIDSLCTNGLGMRYAFIGPLETMHLNANGIKDYCERYAQGAVRVQEETFHQIPVLYDTPTAEKIQDDWAISLPLQKLPERRAWRDNMLAKLSKLKSDEKSAENEELK